MIGDSQRLQGCGGCGVRRAISSTPSKVTRLQGLQGLRGSLSDKFQRYSPSFDIIIIIIILEVDIRGCEVARVSRFRRAISTHITCHIYMYRVVQEKLPNKLKIKSKKNLTETWPFEVDISVRALYTV